MSTTTPNYYTPYLSNLTLGQQRVHTHIQYHMPYCCKEIFYVTPEYRANPAHYLESYISTVPDNVLHGRTIIELIEGLLDPDNPDGLDAKTLATYKPRAVKRILYAIHSIVRQHILWTALYKQRTLRYDTLETVGVALEYVEVLRNHLQNLLLYMQLNSYVTPVISRQVLSVEVMKLKTLAGHVLYCSSDTLGRLMPLVFLCHNLAGFKESVWSHKASSSIGNMLASTYCEAPNISMYNIAQEIRQQCIQYVLRYDKPLSLHRFDAIVSKVTKAHNLLHLIK